MGDLSFAPRLSRSTIQAPLFVIPDLIRDPAVLCSVEEEAGSRIKSGMTSNEMGSDHHG